MPHVGNESLRVVAVSFLRTIIKNQKTKTQQKHRSVERMKSENLINI